MKKLLLLFSMVALAFNAYADNVLVVDDVHVRPGGRANIVVKYLFDSELICGYQLDLLVDAGIEVKSGAENGETIDKTWTIGKNGVGEGHYRYATFSYGEGEGDNDVSGNIPVTDHNGVLLYIPIEVGDLAVGTELNCQIFDVVLPEQTGGQYKPEPITFKVIIDNDAIDTVLDENDTNAPVAKNDANVKVIRSINANEWSTICLPFEMTKEEVQEAFGTSTEEAKLGDFVDWEASSLEDNEDYIYKIDMRFDNVDAIAANHPYIIKTPKDITDFSVLHKDISPNNNAVTTIEHSIKIGGKTYRFYSYMRGNYVAGKLLDKDILFLNDNKFWYSAGNTKIKAFRAYFDVDDKLSKLNEEASSKINILFGDEVTSIKDNVRQNETDKIYSVSGQYMGKDTKRLQRGVYIVNGKKVVKK